MKWWILGSFKSKTMNFFAWMAALVPTLAIYLPEIQNSLPQLKGYIPDNIYKAAFIACVVGGIVLRLVTKTPVTWK